MPHTITYEIRAMWLRQWSKSGDWDCYSVLSLVACKVKSPIDLGGLHLGTLDKYQMLLNALC